MEEPKLEVPDKEKEEGAWQPEDEGNEELGCRVFCAGG